MLEVVIFPEWFGAYHHLTLRDLRVGSQEPFTSKVTFTGSQDLYGFAGGDPLPKLNSGIIFLVIGKIFFANPWFSSRICRADGRSAIFVNLYP